MNRTKYGRTIALFLILFVQEDSGMKYMTYFGASHLCFRLVKRGKKWKDAWAYAMQARKYYNMLHEMGVSEQEFKDEVERCRYENIKRSNKEYLDAYRSPQL
jgi:hypothetical protein